jgi:hypothetical protein
LDLIWSAPCPSFRKAAQQILVSPWTHSRSVFSAQEEDAMSESCKMS